MSIMITMQSLPEQGETRELVCGSASSGVGVFLNQQPPYDALFSTPAFSRLHGEVPYPYQVQACLFPLHPLADQAVS